MTAPPRAAGAQRCTISGWVPEALANGSHGHWSVRQRKLHMAQEMVWLHTHNAGWRPIPGRVRLTVVLVFPNVRRRDTDNLYSRVKGLVDGLVKMVLIDDDSTDVLELVVRAEVRPGVKQTELLLEPAAHRCSIASCGKPGLGDWCDSRPAPASEAGGAL